MRQSMRSSSSSLNNSSRGRCVKIILLNQEELTVFVEGKAKVQDVFNQVCEHLHLRETEYFGLAKFVDDEFQFIEMTSKLHKLQKQPKSWRVQKTEERQVLTLYFRVQYYVEHVSLLKERITRQLYYQQLKDNLLNYSQEVSEEKCFLLTAYSLQADIGNYSQEKHDSHYFDPREYFPAWVVEKRGSMYIRDNMPTIHRDFNNMPKQQASMMYIKELSSPPLPHNMHMYRVKKNKQEETGSVFIAIGPQGVQIFKDEGNFRSLLSTFLWGDIGRLHFEKKKFEIQPSGSGAARKFRYYTGSEDRGKYLLSLCQNSHQFQMGMAPKLAEQKQYEAEDRRYRESYIYSDNVDSSFRNSSVGRWSAGKFSFSREIRGRTSTTSSQTTSGIASERLHTSLDESEEMQEILIDSPPNTKGYSSVLHNNNAGLSPAASMKAHPIATNISQRSSAHSQHSGTHQPQLCIPLKPADIHLQKITFAPTMTVNSQVVRLNQNGDMHTQLVNNQPAVQHPYQGMLNGQLQSISTNAAQSAIGLSMASNTTTSNNQYSLIQQQQQSSLIPQTRQYQTPPHLRQSIANSTGTIPLQPQFAEPLLTQTQHYSPQQQQRQPDHTYANVETLSTMLYTHAASNSNGSCGAVSLNSGNSQVGLSPGISGPLTSTPYQSPQDHTVYRPVSGPTSTSHPPPVARTRDFIVTRPNRSYSQVLPPNKVLSPPQRAVSNADAYIAKRPNRVDCPIHGVRPELFKEIQAKSQRKDTPLLQALCQDRFLLQQEQCTCRKGTNTNEEPLAMRRFSYSQPSSSSTPDLYNQPGTVARPVSWHEPTSLQLFGQSINIDIEQSQHHMQVSDTQQQQLTVHHFLQQQTQKQNLIDNTHFYLQHLTSTTAGQNLQQYSSPHEQQSHLANSLGLRFHQSMDSLDYPTMLTYQSPNEFIPHTGHSESYFPSKLHSGMLGGKLSGSQSVDNLLQSHNYSLGLVT